MEKFKKLTREEMRGISGGELNGCACKAECATDDDCPGEETCDMTVSCSTQSCSYYICSGKL